MNRWKSIYDALRSAGVPVYTAGEHEGACASPYCVVRPSGGALQNSAGIAGYMRYRVHLYAPYDRPAQLETLAEQVRNALAGLVSDGTLALSQPRGATLVDDRFAAHTSYIEYVSYYRER